MAAVLFDSVVQVSGEDLFFGNEDSYTSEQLHSLVEQPLPHEVSDGPIRAAKWTFLWLKTSSDGPISVSIWLRDADPGPPDLSLGEMGEREMRVGFPGMLVWTADRLVVGRFQLGSGYYRARGYRSPGTYRLELWAVSVPVEEPRPAPPLLSSFSGKVEVSDWTWDLTGENADIPDDFAEAGQESPVIARRNYLNLGTGLGYGEVPITISILSEPPTDEPPVEFERVVETDIEITDSSLGFYAENSQPIELAFEPGLYRLRYSGANIEAGTEQDAVVDDEEAPDYYRLEFWPVNERSERRVLRDL
jgi:hypothetical protein